MKTKLKLFFLFDARGKKKTNIYVEKEQKKEKMVLKNYDIKRKNYDMNKNN